jgi:hypothetical protein
MYPRSLFDEAPAFREARGRVCEWKTIGED